MKPPKWFTEKGLHKGGVNKPPKTHGYLYHGMVLSLAKSVVDEACKTSSMKVREATEEEKKRYQVRNRQPLEYVLYDEAK